MPKTGQPDRQVPASTLTGWRRGGFAGLAGAVAAMGLAPFDLWPLGVAGFAAVLFAANTARAPRQMAGLLWLSGIGYFAVALHWIVEPFLVDAATFGWMAPFALVFLSGGLALFWALAGWIAARLIRGGGLARVWVIAGTLVITEFSRATVLTGFPWAQPGHILIGSEALVLSAWIGPYGLTALVLFGAAALVTAIGRFGWIAGAAAAMPVLALGFLPWSPAAPQAADDAPLVRLIQPNAPQDQKWLPEMIPVFFDRGLALTRGGGDDPLPDLVVWPETSLPELLDRSDAARTRLSAAAGDASVLVGTQRIDGFRARNSLAVLDAEGAIADIYDKHHLVPFGEYLPFEAAMNRIGLRAFAATLPNGFRAGPGPATLALPGGLGTVFPMICYEAIFPGYIRQVPRPDWIVHVTNDAWFGAFSGPYQHLAMARLRAAEQGLPVLRAANTGVSAVIDARGQIVASLPMNEAGALDAHLPPALPATLYARTGDWPALVFVLLVTALAWRQGRALPPLQRDA